jgi:hypothetical protein
MNCRFHRAQIEELKRRETLPEETRAHLTRCAACARAYHEQKALQDLISELKPIAAPTNFNARLHAVLAVRKERRARRCASTVSSLFASSGDWRNWLPRARALPSRTTQFVAACCVVAFIATFIVAAWLTQKNAGRHSSVEQRAQISAPIASPLNSAEANEARLSPTIIRSPIAKSRNARFNLKRGEPRKVLTPSTASARLKTRPDVAQNATSSVAKADTSVGVLTPSQKSDFNSTAAPHLTDAKSADADLPNKTNAIIGAFDVNSLPPTGDESACLIGANVARQPQAVRLATLLGIEGVAGSDAPNAQNAKGASFIIKAVVPASLAARAQMRAGDIITTINSLPAAAALDRPVSLSDAHTDAHNAKSKVRKTICILVLRVIRDGKLSDFTLQLTSN